ncbi:hypothetical protein DYBT9623_01344 [Dyadobacter sp. CECT 9623]|uniref:Uncharacterized protein n=1 Tax=Dyadobacter linearis TaxID=2823330 RepID=A0ABM8UMJ4_9BACT|nr:hypothetical protein [Dyadobacter sp. CECT 9623]CAG5068612.1 hypothetical protein DYBT9623_01344 [Dyadobacter sp. CECT 9623]
MKKFITSFAVFALFAFAQVANAQSTPAPINFYVTNGEEFTLTPQGNVATSKLFWRVDGVLNEILGSTLGGVLKLTFSDATTTITKHEIKLSVIADLLAGCESDLVEYNIIVLPKLELALEVPKTNFCVGAEVDVTLNASFLTPITNLVTYGVELPFEWRGPDDEILTETGASLRVVKAGLYKVVAKYKLPAAGALLPTATKLATNIITGTSQQILHNLPLPTIPTIQLL